MRIYKFHNAEYHFEHTNGVDYFCASCVHLPIDFVLEQLLTLLLDGKWCMGSSGLCSYLTYNNLADYCNCNNRYCKPNKNTRKFYEQLLQDSKNEIISTGTILSKCATTANVFAWIVNTPLANLLNIFLESLSWFWKLCDKSTGRHFKKNKSK